MFPLLFVAFSVQAQVTDADVPLILESVVDYVAADSVEFNDQSLGGRPVFIAGEKARAAFAKVAPSVALMESGTEKSFTVVPEDDAMRCADQQDPTTCEVDDNDVLLTISQIKPGTRPQSGSGRTCRAYAGPVERSDVGDGSTIENAIVARSADGWQVTGNIYLHPLRGS